MRIIAGRLRGRRLESPDWPGLRPTSDKLRETLFNVLGARVEHATVLDGFAGSGALGIEAISRGAAHVTFVDQDRRASALIVRNLARCAVTGGYTVLPMPFAHAAARLADDAYDLVLLDPPYDWADHDVLLRLTGPHLRDGGLVVIEHARRREPPACAGTLARTRVVASGDSALSFYARTGERDGRRESAVREAEGDR